ncbi:MAG: polymer-forming cytoskeletal protein [Hyphomicrobiaceae bacterium]
MLPTFKKAESDPIKPPALGNMGGAPTGASQPPRPAGPMLRAGTERNAPSVIGPDLVITGNLVSKGEMQIDGEVQGDIRGSNIIVGERARITGTIIADEAIVRGQVMGSIRSRRVMLQSQSRVEGDIFHQTLSIEQGAYFEGKSRRTDDPTAGVPAVQMPPGDGPAVTVPAAS